MVIWFSVAAVGTVIWSYAFVMLLLILEYVHVFCVVAADNMIG
jgi:hypothetical protein